MSTLLFAVLSCAGIFYTEYLYRLRLKAASDDFDEGADSPNSQNVLRWDTSSPVGFLSTIRRRTSSGKEAGEEPVRPADMEDVPGSPGHLISKGG